MEFDWSQGELAKGLQCYRNQEFWFAHEHWEAVWLQCEQPDKTFLQALIQVTAAFHHLQRANLIGFASLLHAALRRLDSFPTVYGNVDVARLREEIHLWLRSLDTPDSSPQPLFPKIIP